MTEYLKFFVKRFAQLGDQEELKSKSIILLNDDESYSNTLKELKKLAENCEAEKALKLSLSIAKKHLKTLESLPEKLIEFGSNPKADAKQWNSRKYKTFKALELVILASKIFCTINAPSSSRRGKRFLLENSTAVETMISDGSIYRARKMLVELLISLRILKKSNDPNIVDVRCLIRTLDAVMASHKNFDEQVSGKFELWTACEIMKRPMSFPSWVRKIDPCCSHKNEPEKNNSRLANSYPFAKLQKVKDYERKLQEILKCKEEFDKKSSANSAAKDEQADCDCGSDCGCKCDDTCMPQNPCCYELNSYVTDLMTVRETIDSYEAGELAHIQNVMAGETLDKRHTLVKESEEFSEEETFSSKSEEHDTKSTERFELQEAAQKTVQQDFSADAGITTSGSYGVAGNEVAVTTSANVAYSSSKSDASQTAQNFAKDITQRSVIKIQEDKRSLSTSRQLRRVTEMNRHKFTASDKHIIGQYFYVNKKSSAQVLNWGKRLTYEFILPRPAALYKHLMEKRVGEKRNSVDVPDELIVDFSANQITDKTPNAGQFNYLDLVKKFGLNNVSAPPVEFGHLHFNVNSQVGAIQLIDAGTVPGGYSVVGYASDTWAVSTLFFGGTHIDGVGNNTTVDLFFAEDTAIKVTVVNQDDHVGSPGSGWIKYTRGEKIYKDWQNEVFAAVLLAAEKRRQEIKNAQEDQKSHQLFNINGRNPFLNRETEQTEIKRQIISMITCQHFDRFDAMVNAVEPCGYPQLDFQKAQEQGAFIQFCEQAFEWKQMMYLFYPYFWGEKCGWADTIETDSGDALFDKFLSAGAARVSISVRPGFELQMLHYENTGEIWMGNGEPDYDDSVPHYVAMHEEFRNQTGDYSEGRDGLLDVEMNYIDDSGNAMSLQGNQVIIKGIDLYWNWNGTPIPGTSDHGSEDYSTIENDIDREIIIAGKHYRIVEIDHFRGIADGLTAPVIPTTASEQNDPNFIKELRWLVTLDRDVELKTSDSKLNRKYSVGALVVGDSFEITTPTHLVWLRPNDSDSGQYANCLPDTLPVKC